MGYQWVEIPIFDKFFCIFEFQLLRRLIIWNYQSGHGSSLQILVKPFSGKAPLLLNFVDTAIALVSFIKNPLKISGMGLALIFIRGHIQQFPNLLRHDRSFGSKG